LPFKTQNTACFCNHIIGYCWHDMAVWPEDEFRHLGITLVQIRHIKDIFFLHYLLKSSMIFKINWSKNVSMIPSSGSLFGKMDLFSVQLRASKLEHTQHLVWKNSPYLYPGQIWSHDPYARNCDIGDNISIYVYMYHADRARM
jgi:hypothetical protein